MAQRRYSIGTSPEIIANDNPRRASITITMLPQTIEAGNTGRVHIGKGFSPSSTLGSGNQGDPIVQGGQISEQASFPNDPSLFRGAWWAVASVAAQIITVDEMTEVAKPEK